MLGNIVSNQFGAYKYDAAIWNEKIRVTERRVELAYFAFVAPAEDHWLPRIAQELFELTVCAGGCRSSGEMFV